MACLKDAFAQYLAWLAGGDSSRTHVLTAQLISGGSVEGSNITFGDIYAGTLSNIPALIHVQPGGLGSDIQNVLYGKLVSTLGDQKPLIIAFHDRGLVSVDWEGQQLQDVECPPGRPGVARPGATDILQVTGRGATQNITITIWKSTHIHLHIP